MKRSPYEIAIQVAAEQRRSLADPCLKLDCTVLELEQRLNRLEPAALEAIDLWLGSSWRRALDRLA